MISWGGLRRAKAIVYRLGAVSLLIIAACAWDASKYASAANKYASIVIDHNAGRVLYARNADEARFPASLTKIMTLYMVFDRLKAKEIDLDSRLTVSKYAASRPPSKVGLKPGQTIRVVDAIRALVTKSANDVATVVAENLGQTESQFARMMTIRAREIGMSRTTFRNASGLPNNAQLTTARDMATLSRRIMTDHPEYYGFFRLKYFQYRGKRYRNHNGLLFGYKGTDGIKTGYTRASGFNLAASTRRGKKHLVAVVMGGRTSKTRNQHMRSLLERHWKRASSRRRPMKPLVRPPLPRRNPIERKPVPVASAPVQTAAVSARLPWAPGISLIDADPRQAVNGPGHTFPATEAASRSRSREGDFHVQVGAYSSQKEAAARLSAVLAEARGMLEGHDPITMPLPDSKRYLFRARFAGFSEGSARKTCSALKRKKIPCIVMRAE